MQARGESEQHPINGLLILNLVKTPSKSFWKIEKEVLNHCYIRCSLNVKKFFRLTCKNNTLKKLKRCEIVEPSFKYIID